MEPAGSSRGFWDPGDEPGMKRKLGHAVLMAVLGLAPAADHAQQRCPNGVRVEGTVADPAGALIPGATVRGAGGEQATADGAGHYVLPCVTAGSGTLTARAEGFATATRKAGTPAGGAAHVNFQLALARVETDVQVSADANAMDPDRGPDTTSLNAAQVQRLPDDPDDLLRQLQVLASAAGGDPTAATITVDGFQNGSALPPKGSIASIRVNPDSFSAEYRGRESGGGVVEIVTKPGSDTWHGAAFFTESDGSFNATDPFSVTATPASKQRYGFELSGPAVKNRAGFSLALEKRDIDEFNVVNAFTLGADGAAAPLHQTISAPQRLWNASARSDMQMTPKDMAVISFSANANNLANQGAGGLVLAENGYASLESEYDLHLSNTFTPSATALHETRIGMSWKRTDETPNSTEPSLTVAGDFVGGGATSQNLNDRERDLEIDDDTMLTRGRHTVKFGAQSLGLFVHDFDPDTFNGAYVFGGGSAPVLGATNQPTGQTTTITALEQYWRALHGLAGGTPTTYQVTTGTALVPFTQWQVGLFVQDVFKILPQLTLNAGLRYQLHTTPGSFASLGPRAGIAWALNKKQTWVIRMHGGLFNNFPDNLGYVTDVHRLNGTRQRQTTVYSPSYANPLAPAAGSIAIRTAYEYPHSLAQPSTFIGYLNVEHDLGRHWITRGNFYWGEDWNSLRTVNVNAPLVASSVGTAPDPTVALLAPRPIAPNENIFQYQNSGHLNGYVTSFNLEQHSLKRIDTFFRYGHASFKANVVGDSSGVNSPQSSYSQRGESARVEWSRNNSFTLNGHAILPEAVEVAGEFDAGEGHNYTPVTGTDNNGDGNFNDRPSYAAAPGPGVYATKFGLLTTNTVNGDVPRNIGMMPWPIHLDMNVSRAFNLSKDKDRPRSVTVNARSANLLNHTNVTAVSTVVSSPTFSQPIAAEAARRIELGARFSF